MRKKPTRYVTDLLGQRISDFIEQNGPATFADILRHLQECSNVRYTLDSQRVVADKLNRHPAFHYAHKKWDLTRLSGCEFTRAIND